jgi:hypothetical protein
MKPEYHRPKTEHCTNSKAVGHVTEPAALPCPPYVPFGIVRVVETGSEVMRQTSPSSLPFRSKGDAPVRPRKNSATRARSSCDLLITRGFDRVATWTVVSLRSTKGAIMAKRKKASKVQKQAKLRRANSAKRGKARRVSKAAKATKRTVAKAKPKSAPVKNAARRVKQPVAPAVETVAETVAVEVIDQSVPGVTEVEETRKAS